MNSSLVTFRQMVRTGLVLGCCVLMAAGCGYRPKAAGVPVGTHIGSLAIELIPSNASTPGFEGDFTGMIRREFVSHARIPLVPEARADTVLEGRVHEISTDPLSYDVVRNTVQNTSTTYATTSTRRLRVRLEVRLIDRRNGAVIWEDAGMEEKASFDVGTDPLSTRYNRTRALETIARRLAEKIYSRTMERF